MTSCSCRKCDDRRTGNCLTCTDVCRCKDFTNIVNDDESNNNYDDKSEGDSGSDFSDLKL